MKYESFCAEVQKVVRAAGLSAQFSNEDGKFVAKVPDGPCFIGNAVSERFSVRWGSGHEKFATMEQMQSAVSALVGGALV